MLRALFVASTLGLAAAFTACGGSSGTPTVTGPRPSPSPSPTVHVRVSPQPRPTDVPEAATPVVETSARGSITPQASLTPITSDLRELTAARCENGLLTIETSLETIYAKLSCDLFSSDQFNQHFTGKPAALVLEVSPNRYRILITTVDGAHAEFTPDAIWVQ